MADAEEGAFSRLWRSDFTPQDRVAVILGVVMLATPFAGAMWLYQWRHSRAIKPRNIPLIFLHTMCYMLTVVSALVRMVAPVHVCGASVLSGGQAAATLANDLFQWQRTSHSHVEDCLWQGRRITEGEIRDDYFSADGIVVPTSTHCNDMFVPVGWSITRDRPLQIIPPEPGALDMVADDAQPFVVYHHMLLHRAGGWVRYGYEATTVECAENGGRPLHAAFWCTLSSALRLLPIVGIVAGVVERLVRIERMLDMQRYIQILGPATARSPFRSTGDSVRRFVTYHILPVICLFAVRVIVSIWAGTPCDTTVDRILMILYIAIAWGVALVNGMFALMASHESVGLRFELGAIAVIAVAGTGVVAFVQSLRVTIKTAAQVLTLFALLHFVVVMLRTTLMGGWGMCRDTAADLLGQRRSHTDSTGARATRRLFLPTLGVLLLSMAIPGAWCALHACGRRRRHRRRRKSGVLAPSGVFGAVPEYAPELPFSEDVLDESPVSPPQRPIPGAEAASGHRSGVGTSATHSHAGPFAADATFEEMMTNRVLQQTFLAFMQREFCAENLMFLHDCENLKNPASIRLKDLIPAAERIESQYIGASAAWQLNLPYGVVRTIQRKLGPAKAAVERLVGGPEPSEEGEESHADGELSPDLVGDSSIGELPARPTIVPPLQGPLPPPGDGAAVSVAHRDDAALARERSAGGASATDAVATVEPPEAAELRSIFDRAAQIIAKETRLDSWMRFKRSRMFQDALR